MMRSSALKVSCLVPCEPLVPTEEACKLEIEYACNIPEEVVEEKN